MNIKKSLKEGIERIDEFLDSIAAQLVPKLTNGDKSVAYGKYKGHDVKLVVTFDTNFEPGPQNFNGHPDTWYKDPDEEKIIGIDNVYIYIDGLGYEGDYDGYDIERSLPKTFSKLEELIE